MKRFHNPWITLEEWLEWYHNIVKELQFDELADLEASMLLDSMLKGKVLEFTHIERMLSGKISVVFGAGPSVEVDIKKFVEFPQKDDFVIVAADGATTALLEHHIIPDIIVTDLDGNVDDLLRAHVQGSILVVHAHGDNIPQLKNIVPLLHERVLPTTQIEPFGCLYNFGGFTDGDRAVFLSSSVNVKAIVLAGMDLEGGIGSFSKPLSMLTHKQLIMKRKKLKIAKELLEWLATKIPIPMYDITTYGVGLRGTMKLESFYELSLHELR
ncbi:MAG: 6-hydroxymethylpterin diphosphokinase MptE-like protein [Nitrososphaerota archaeon]